MKTLAGAVLLCAALTACGQATEVTPKASQSLPPKGCHTSVSVTESGTGQTVCVTRGGTVSVTLHAPTGGPAWTGPDATGPVRPGTSRKSPGVAESSWTTTAVGRATITARRSNCPAKPAAGTVSCLSMQGFTLTVKIV